MTVATASVASLHDRYRDRLRALAAVPGAWGWTTLSTRFDPGCEPYATLVCDSGDGAQALVRIEAFGSRPSAAATRSETAGWLRLVPFPADPLLPTLPALLAAYPEATVMRYHPSRRCTLRAARGGRTQFVKVFAEHRAEDVHRALQSVWRAHRRGELGFAVGRPAGIDREVRAVWQDGIAGVPVEPRLFGPDGPGLATRMGRAAASLTGSQVRPRVMLDAPVLLDLSRRRADELARRVPLLAAEMAELLGRLRDIHAGAAGGRPRPVHGAPRPNQWLLEEDGLALLDFDGLALGHAELDAAAFVTAVAAEDRSRVGVDQLNTAFLSGYESVAGPLDPDLLAAHCAHRWLAKAVKAACAVRSDGDRRAHRRVVRALDCLAEAGA